MGSHSRLLAAWFGFMRTSVILSPYIEGKRTYTQVRFPRSKRRRIRRKWSKDLRNWGWVEGPAAIDVEGVVYVNRPAWELLKRGVSVEACRV